MTRICKTCKIEKDLSEFNKSKQHKYGVDNQCRECSKAYRRTLKVNKHQKIREYIETTKRICRTCGIEKPAIDFNFNYRDRNGLATKCKQCDATYKDSSGKLYRKEYYLKNKSKMIEAASLYSKKRRATYHTKFKEFFSNNPCSTCGESDPAVLEFHHVVPENKTECVSVLAAKGASWDDILIEIEKCIVLCANCHRRVTAKDQGWYTCMDSSV